MRGFAFNGVNSSTFGLIAQSKNRQLMPQQKDSYLQVPCRHGSYLFPRELSDRVIDIQCGLVAVDQADLRTRLRQIAAWLYTTERKQLIFDDEPELHYMAKLDAAVDIEQTGSVAEFSVRFRCEPLAYGSEQTMSFVDGHATPIVAGTFATPPLFCLNVVSAANWYRIAHLGTGQYLRVGGAFIPGDQIEIHHTTGLAMVNGYRALNALEWQFSEFFDLSPGANQIEITSDGMCGATVTWTSRHI